MVEQETLNLLVRGSSPRPFTTSFFPVTRFAPTPSGGLHFGSLVAALAGYLFVRSSPLGRWYLRFDDGDTLRNVPGATDQIMRQLEGFHLHWDGPVVYQSEHVDEYQAVLEEWSAADLVFPCSCSRQDLDRQGAVRNASGERIYPGNCRTPGPATAQDSHRAHEQTTLRLDVLGLLRRRTFAVRSSFDDIVQGQQEADLDREWPAPVVRRADGIVAYHLANVVDDRRMGVTHVIRGADLLGVTHVHRILEGLLPAAASQLDRHPILYGHVPLVTDEHGRKLSKSDRDILDGEVSGAGGIGAARLLRRALCFLGFTGLAAESADCAELLEEALGIWKGLAAAKSGPETT